MSFYIKIDESTTPTKSPNNLILYSKINLYHPHLAKCQFHYYSHQDLYI